MKAPTWALWHPARPLLYAVSECDDGSVATVRLTTDSERDAVLTELRNVSTGGSGPCHLALTPDSEYLLVANYSSGSVSSIALSPDGETTVLTDTVHHSGSGLHAERQSSPHPHQIVVSREHGTVSVVDLGTDEIRTYILDAGRFETIAVSRLPAGTGPRQMVRVPGTSTALVVGELSGRLLTLDEVRPGDFSILGDAPASGRPGPNHPSQLTLNSGGSMAYVANRGPDTIAAFDVSTTPAQLIAEQDTGAHPRHFALTDGQVLVGGQNDNSLNVHTIGPNGHLGAVIRYETFAPSCIAPKPDSIL